MKTNGMDLSLQNKALIRIVLVVAFLLLLPLIAMQFTDEVKWGLADFAIAGVLLFGTGLAFDWLARRAGSLAYRAAAGAALATALLLVWVNLAVGVLGSEDNPANLMVAGVLAVGIVGAAAARFRPLGMARALFATALAQALVAVIALIALKDLPPFEVLMVNGFFGALWLGSALLFWRAHVTQNQRPG